MGGPCYLIDRTTSKRTVGPSCTDNFQIIGFTFENLEWYSVEQCFQAVKFFGDRKFIIWNTAPYSDERDDEYGLRIWAKGQDHKEQMNPRWEEEKIHIMYLINRSKYRCNKHLQEELLSTDDSIIWGKPSTHQWQKWNGIIQMIIRDEIRNGSLEQDEPLTREALEERCKPYIALYIERRLLRAE